MIGGSLLAGRPLLRSDYPSTNASGTEAKNSARDDEVGDDRSYRLVSINAAHAPDGCSGGDWFVHRIAQGGNGITGPSMRQFRTRKRGRAGPRNLT
jgi:hypothetical protein